MVRFVRKLYFWILVLLITGLITEFIILFYQHRLKLEYNDGMNSSENKFNFINREEENILYWTGHESCYNVPYKSDLNITSHLYSTVKLISNKNCLLKVQITAFSGLNVSKGIGGDVFIVWAEQIQGDGCVAGEVIDNKNGTYFGIIKSYWKGATRIRAKLISTVENFCIRRNAIIRYGDSAFAMLQPLAIIGTFYFKPSLERARCGNEHTLYGYEDICNFSQLNDNSPWYCGAPKHPKLQCSDIHYFTMYQFNKSEFMPTTENTGFVKIMGHGELKQNVIVQSLVETYVQEGVPCNKISREMSWSYNPPNGYYMNKIWHNSNCKHTITFDAHSYRSCLQNKSISLFGDSTIRAYTDYFMTEVLQLPKVDWKHFKSKNWTFHPPVEFTNFGIRLSFKSHEMPLYGFNVPAYGVTSVPTEIIKLAKCDILGKDLVVIVTYCPHLQAFSPDLFRFKMRRLASAIRVLLKAKPDASVFLKGPYVFFQDVRWFDSRMSLIQKDITFETFKDLKSKVYYLDIWSVTVAHNSEEKHPKDQAFTSQIQQFMSYLCSN